MAQESVTIYQVAKQAKVSPVTVSRAFSQQAPVAERTRKRILAVAQELGYQPSPFARAMRGAATKSIGVLWSLGGSPQAALAIRDMALAAQREGYVTYVVDSLADPTIIRDALADFDRRRVDAVVLQQNTTYDWIEEFQTELAKFKAVAVVGDRHANPTSFDTVLHSRLAVYRELAERLIDAGRKHLVFLGDPNSNHSKIQPLQEICRKHDVCFQTIALSCTGTRITARDYITALQASIDQNMRFDALICGNDSGATATLTCLRKHGWRVPEDVAVIGCDDIETSEFLDPPLATVDQHDGVAAKAAIELIFARLKNPKLPPQQKVVPMQIMWRSSAGIQV